MDYLEEFQNVVVVLELGSHALILFCTSVVLVWLSFFFVVFPGRFYSPCNSMGGLQARIKLEYLEIWYSSLYCVRPHILHISSL